MVTITIPRLLVKIAQAPFGLNGGFDPETAHIATEAACQHFANHMTNEEFDALADASADHLPRMRKAERVVAMLINAAIDGNNDAFDADGEYALEGVDFAFEPEPPLVVKKWLRWGALDECDGMTGTEIVEQACNLMDDANTPEIIGEVVFEATDGKYYVGTVEFEIGEASPDYVRDVLAAIAEEGEEEDDDGEET